MLGLDSGLVMRLRSFVLAWLLEVYKVVNGLFSPFAINTLYISAK